MPRTSYCRTSNVAFYCAFITVRDFPFKYVQLIITRSFSRCEVVVDPKNPLLNPKTEAEWFSLFSRRPTYELGGGLMLVENINIIVKERKQWYAAYHLLHTLTSIWNNKIEPTGKSEKNAFRFAKLSIEDHFLYPCHSSLTLNHSTFLYLNDLHQTQSFKTWQIQYFKYIKF